MLYQWDIFGQFEENISLNSQRKPKTCVFLCFFGVFVQTWGTKQHAHVIYALRVRLFTSFLSISSICINFVSSKNSRRMWRQKIIHRYRTNQQAYFSLHMMYRPGTCITWHPKPRSQCIHGYSQWGIRLPPPPPKKKKMSVL